jgi:hypothetical protein
MKNHLTIIFIFLISISFAQSEIEIHLDSDPGVNYNGQTILDTSTTPSFNVYMRVVNKTNADLEVLFRRVIKSSDVDFYDQFCDQNLCHSCSGQDWTSPSETPIQISPNDSSLMKPQGTFLDEGTATIRYYIIDNSNAEILDSVDLSITYNSVTGNQITQISNIVEYPNPANQLFNVDVQSENNLKLILFSITGKKIYETQLYQGNNQLNLDNLNSGMYLYSILSGEETIKTKRLIVK